MLSNAKQIEEFHKINQMIQMIHNDVQWYPMFPYDKRDYDKITACAPKGPRL